MRPIIINNFLHSARILADACDFRDSASRAPS